MKNLRVWLENIDALCGKVLREPTSGLHKMNLVTALSLGRPLLKIPTGGGQKIDGLVGRFAETTETLKRRIWGTEGVSAHQYLGFLRALIEGFRREIIALIAETHRPLVSHAESHRALLPAGLIATAVATAQSPETSGALVVLPSAQRTNLARPIRIRLSSFAFLWTGFAGGLGRMVKIG
jgi:hypothetical protein